MRISDWSSDVCSSDLGCAVRGQNSVLGSLDRQPKPALPCNEAVGTWRTECLRNKLDDCLKARHPVRSEEHTSELQSLMRISYAVFCLNKKNKNTTITLYTAVESNNREPHR